MKKYFTYIFVVGAVIGGTPRVDAASTTTCTDVRGAINGKTELVHNGVVTVDCSQNQKPNAQTCKAVCNNGTSTVVITECKYDYYELEPLTILSVAGYNQCGTEREACIAAGSPAVWNDTVRPARCDCGGNAKQWDRDQQKCVDSDEYVACSAATDAYWDNGAGECRCTAAGMEWRGGSCQKSVSETECTALASSCDNCVKWNAGTRKCVCLKDKNGDNINSANSADYEIDPVFGDGCIKTVAAQARERRAELAPEITAQKERVTNIVTELEQISNTWGRSHWKNASGGFNTARLASDSIAGVVLGTVGGVVTSNVVKKNQVQDGFEDIGCVVGGQRVADWGDAFTVGVKF